MPSRELTILCTGLVLAALAGLVVFGQSAAADELPPVAPAPAPEPAPAAPLPEAPPAASHELAPAPAKTGEPSAARVDTTGWTTGMVKGDVQLAVSALGRIESIRIEIEEARNRNAGGPAPFRRVVPLERGRGTPTFAIGDIPFSEYPYVVSVVSPGLNGSRRTLTLDARAPLVDDIVLTITPGAPLTILLRDQDGMPYVGLDVRAVPVGEPHGRGGHHGTSDNFGSLVFEDVLAGDYEVTVLEAGAPVTTPQPLRVQAGAQTLAAGVRGQGHTIVIERGVPVHVMVCDGAGYPLVGTEVVAVATDRIKLTQLRATADARGFATFPHLQPGRWSLAIRSELHEPWERQQNLVANQAPVQLEARLVPRR